VTPAVAPVLAGTPEFEPLTVQHYVPLLVFAVGVVAVVHWGRRNRGTAQEVRHRRGFAVTVAVVGLAMQGYQLTPDDFSLATSLPLALCDVGTVASVIALWTRSPRAAAFVYYVGLSLTTQGILTPSLAEGFPHPRYFGFWALHLLVVWSAVYLTWGLGMRPTWRLYRSTVLITLTWAVTAYCFNVVADTNYGYLNRKPSSASLLDLLGPWPWYVLAEIALVVSLWALVMTWPWTWSRTRDRTEVSAPA
jgi:hypothetical integral membrane protein (TIGR02206 family)